jgi:hypothetical protein
MESRTRTQQILIVMNVLAWIAFIGLLIKTGALIVSYSISWWNPDAAHNLYRGLDLHDLRDAGFWWYSQSVSFLIAFDAMRAFVMYLVIRTLSKVNLVSPFTREVCGSVEKISHVLFGIWLVAMLSNAHGNWILKKTGELVPMLDTGEFLFMAGLVFVISQVFKRGLEIQSENELTV